MDDGIQFISYKRLEEDHAIENAKNQDQSEDNTNDVASTPIETEILASATENAKNEDQSEDNTSDVVSRPTEREIRPGCSSRNGESGDNQNNVVPTPTEREVQPGCSSGNYDKSEDNENKTSKCTSEVYLNSNTMGASMQDICENEEFEDKTSEKISIVTKTDLNSDQMEAPMQDTCENKKTSKFNSEVYLDSNATRASMQDICENEESEDKTSEKILNVANTHLNSDEIEVPMQDTCENEEFEYNMIEILPEPAVEERPVQPIRGMKKLRKTAIKVPSEYAVDQPADEQVSEDDDPATNTANEEIDTNNKQRRRKAYSIKRITCVAIIAITAIATIVMCLPAINKVPSPINVPRALFMQTDHEIWTMDPRNLSCHLFMQQPLKTEFIAFDVYKNKTMLWLERNTTTIKSLLKQNMKVTYPRQWNPRGVALDFVTEKLYVIDELAEVLYVLDVKNNHHGVVLSDLKRPIDIVLDPPRGFMFIVQKNDSILRANMDGSSRTEILTNQSVSAITIDRKTRKLYWIERENNVISSNYDGSNQTNVLELAYARVNSLTIYNDQIYCLSSNRIQAHQHSVVLFCKIDSGTCVHLMERKMPFYSSMIRAPSELLSKPVINPCAEDNGGCEHMCLLKPNGGSNCACQTGWQLKGDTGSCEPVDRYILYSQGNYFRGRVVDPTKDTFVETITPTWFHVGPVKIRERRRETVSFDRGWNSNEVFLNDDNSVYRLSLDDGHQSLLKEVKSTYHIEALAVDRMSRNVYFLQISKFSKSHAIKAITLKNNQVLVKTVTHITFGKDVVGLTPDSLVTHPYRSQLFYRIHTTSTKLTSIYPSCSKPKVYAHLQDSTDDGSIALDARNNRTYWVDKVSRYGIMIAYAAWSNGEVESFDVESAAFSGEPQFRYSLSAHNKTLYVSDFRSVWSMDKNYGKKMTRLFPNVEHHAAARIAGVRFINSLDFKREKKSECMVDNGGCEEFCFMEGTKVCDCQDKYEVERDGSCRYNAIRSGWVTWNYSAEGNGIV